MKKPKAVCCYICGREFGTASIEIHLKSCQKKWEIEQSQKPKNERKPCPQPPKSFDLAIGGGMSAQQLEEMNNEAFKSYNEKALDPCPNCGRTFLPDRLVVHLRSCKQANGKQETSSPGRNEKGGLGGGGGIGGNQMSQSMKVGGSGGGGGGGGLGGSSSSTQFGSPSATFKKPKTLVCYVCGKEFGTSSLEIHIKACKKKWETEQSQKPKHERKPLPQPPQNFEEMLAGNIDQSDMEQYNNSAAKTFNENGLDACPNCGRTFLPDRLQVHLRSCNKSNGKQPQNSPSPPKAGAGFGGGGGGGGGGGSGGSGGSGGMGSSGGMSSPSKMIQKPKTLVCYICGREFGTSSLEIHLKACKKKWEIDQSQKPKHERKPLPQPPKNFEEMLIGGGGGAADMDEYNNAAAKSYNEKALDACPNCARTFLPDRLIVHLKSCNKAHGKADQSPDPKKGSFGGGGGGKGGNQGSQSPSKPAFIQRPKTIVCYICGREYGTASIEIHLKTCKQKWEIEESKKPPKERRPVPQAPKSFDDMVIGVKSGASASDMQNYNDEAFKQYNEVSLMACHNCGRTFLPDRLTVHLRSCDKQHPKKKQQDEFDQQMNTNASNSSILGTPSINGKSIKAGETDQCSLCGRQFGKNLMEQHVKACQKRWTGQQPQQVFQKQ